MRLWTLHPSYLDSKGLVAVWREALLAKKVLQNNTSGYLNHPQLIRFRNHANPVRAINTYLAGVLEEAKARNYRFDSSKIDPDFGEITLLATRGQLNYETTHLMKKLKLRDPKRFEIYHGSADWKAHRIFQIIPGTIEPWEKR